mgnify:CR=1 FL=1
MDKAGGTVSKESGVVHNYWVAYDTNFRGKVLPEKSQIMHNQFTNSDKNSLSNCYQKTHIPSCQLCPIFVECAHLGLKLEQSYSYFL